MSRQQMPDDPHQDPYFDVPRTIHHTTEGRVDLPMLFFNTALRQVSYWVPLERAAAVLEDTGLVPCRFFNGKALVTLIFFQYRDVTVGAYDEVVINIMVRPKMLPDARFYLPNLLKQNADDWNVMAGYVLEMPVTIPEARAAGRELWGYPKFETRIPFRLGERDFEFGVDDPDSGEALMRARGEMGRGITLPGSDYLTYTNFQGKILRTVTRVKAKVTTSFRGRVDLQVSDSGHRLASNLRTLGLAQLQPFLLQRCDHARTRLEVGEEVAEWPTPPLAYAKEGVHP
ncbi:hypothetical protein F0M18_07490 [Pseudohalioglobus sediminis]|uniref:Acetoacetate decarboxylase n=1 Tax=Pseudohalioglobus sediminis TaxID=2606449 RepID=A0A5B0WZQ7_9GAMM|nr:acetoacetate decarboxylase family protein [Pseudohalioglobus sediminis]KAA1192506.1 hypothetical protein F0M18_07490 [Pseudohalioglobus sediminis]